VDDTILRVEIGRLSPLKVNDELINPRSRTHNTKDLQASIEEHGLLQPPVITPINSSLDYTDPKQMFYIVLGERRVTACRALGWKTVECIVKTSSLDVEGIAYLATGNVQQEFSPLQLANLARILAEQGQNKHYISRTIGRTVSTVELLFKLLEASEKVRGLVDSGKLSMSAFRTICARSSEEQDAIIEETKVRNEDGRVTRNAIKSARKRHDDAKKGNPLAGDEVTVRTVAHGIEQLANKLNKMAPFERSEKTVVRHFLERFAFIIEELEEVLA